MRDFRPVTQEIISVMQEDAYRKGAEDLWHAVRTIVLKPVDGGMTLDEYRMLFIEDDAYNVILREDPMTLIDKITSWEKCKTDKEIHIGDVVIYNGRRGIVLRTESDHRCPAVWVEGEDCVTAFRTETMIKTGQSFPEVAKVLRAIKERENLD